MRKRNPPCSVTRMVITTRTFSPLWLSWRQSMTEESRRIRSRRTFQSGMHYTAKKYTVCFYSNHFFLRLSYLNTIPVSLTDHGVAFLTTQQLLGISNHFSPFLSLFLFLNHFLPLSPSLSPAHPVYLFLYLFLSPFLSTYFSLFLS